MKKKLLIYKGFTATLCGLEEWATCIRQTHVRVSVLISGRPVSYCFPEKLLSLRRLTCLTAYYESESPLTRAKISQVQ